jgi:hypothetical protein
MKAKMIGRTEKDPEEFSEETDAASWQPNRVLRKVLIFGPRINALKRRFMP